MKPKTLQLEDENWKKEEEFSAILIDTGFTNLIQQKSIFSFSVSLLNERKKVWQFLSEQIKVLLCGN